MSSGLETAVGLLTAASLSVVLVGAGVRLILVPWLKEHVIAPTSEIRRQVSTNGHVSNPPTLLDEVHTLKRSLAAAARMFDGHMDSSARDRARLWEAIDELRDDRAALERGHERDPQHRKADRHDYPP